WRPAASLPGEAVPQIADVPAGEGTPQLVAEFPADIPAEPSASLHAEALLPSRPSAVLPDPTPVISDPSTVLPDPIGDPAPATPSSKTAPFEDEVPEKAVPSSKPAPDEDGSKVLLALDGPEPRRRPRVSIGLQAGTGSARRASDVSMQSAPYLAALTFLNTVDPSRMPDMKSNYRNTKEIGAAANAFFPESASGRYGHDLPLSLGLLLRADLTPRLNLESGLEYTYLHSVEGFAGSRIHQRLHFIGIPVRLDASLWTNGGWGLYAGLGGKVEKCVSARLGRVECEEPRLQWSAEAFGGIRYQIRPHAQLYFQPALSYYFTKTDLPTYRTEHPLGLSLHAGLRFDL
ncbi:MAG: hypothetical protein IKX28_07360, partial [Bacteroidales bacterium]|nr:hypothetical protein [Bacteroidales bacterium]